MSTTVTSTRVAPRRIYLAIGVLMLAIAIAGFWPSYYGQILPGTLRQPPVIHLHAAVFLGWLFIVIAQAWLAATGRITLHRRLGRFLFIYGVLVIFVGWFLVLVLFAERVHAGEVTQARNQLFVPFTDMLFFAPVLFAAWALRRRSEFHKRLIIVATTVLLIAAAHRFIGVHIGRPPPLWPVMTVWLAPILVAMGHDLVTRRIVHPVYVIGIAWISCMKLRAPLRSTSIWEGFSSWLATLVA